MNAARTFFAFVLALGARLDAPGGRCRLDQGRGLPERRPPVDRPRPPVAGRPGDLTPTGSPATSPARRSSPPPTPRSPLDGVRLCIRSPMARRRSTSPSRARRSRSRSRWQATAMPPLSFRLDVMPVFMRAGCNTGSVPRRGEGQGRLPDLPLRLRPRRRPLPADPRDGRPPGQPGRPRRQHAPRKSRSAPSPTPAASGWKRATNITPRSKLDRGRRPQRRRRQAPEGRRGRAFPRNGGPRRREVDPADDRPGQVFGRDRPRRHLARRLPHQ